MVVRRQRVKRVNCGTSVCDKFGGDVAACIGRSLWCVFVVLFGGYFNVNFNNLFGKNDLCILWCIMN